MVVYLKSFLLVGKPLDDSWCVQKVIAAASIMIATITSYHTWYLLVVDGEGHRAIRGDIRE